MVIYKVVVSGNGFKPETVEFVQRYNFTTEGKMRPIVLLDLHPNLIGKNLHNLLKGTQGKKPKILSSTKASVRVLQVRLPTSLPTNLKRVTPPKEPVAGIIARPASNFLMAAKNPNKEEMEQAQVDPLSECEEEVTN